MKEDLEYSTAELIISHIEETNYIIGNIREFQELILNVSDPHLKILYEEDVQSETKQLMKVCENLRFLLTNYINECNQFNRPIDINFYRVYKELHKLGDLDG
jgi:protein subunit release factor A